MSRLFESICLVGITTLSKDELNRIQAFSKTKLRYFQKIPKSVSEIRKQIGISDCLLASRHLKLTNSVLEKTPKLKYLGVYGTSMENIDLEYAKSRAITVKNVPQYYDYDIVEYIIAELLQKMRGLGRVVWSKAPSSLVGKTIGIVGLGAVGKGLTKVSHALGMEAVYFDKSRHQDVERAGVPFRDLELLLREADIVSLNVSVTSPMFLKKHFDLMKEGTILISISDGEVLKISDFSKWIKNPNNLAIFDGIGGEKYHSFKNLKNVSISPRDAYVTKESFERLSVGFFKNITEYLDSDR